MYVKFCPKITRLVLVLHLKCNYQDSIAYKELGHIDSIARVASRVTSTALCNNESGRISEWESGYWKSLSIIESIYFHLDGQIWVYSSKLMNKLYFWVLLAFIKYYSFGKYKNLAKHWVFLKCIKSYSNIKLALNYVHRTVDIKTE